MIVLKFGGTSIGAAGPIRRLAEIVVRALPRHPVVVVSAVGGVTNALFRLADLARTRTPWKPELDLISARHRVLVDELQLDSAIIEPLLAELNDLVRGIELIGEATPRTLDLLASFGERLAARIVAAHLVRTPVAAGNGATVRARALDAWDVGLVTDGRFGAARPLPTSAQLIRQALDELAREARLGDDRLLVPVITGYIGRDAVGHVTTLGRGGSDYSAAIFGAALGAEEIQIWTDVDGVMSADPRIVANARQRPKLSFAEAAELAFFGAKVLHPATMVPAIEKNIPIRVLNSFRPDNPGTTVVRELALSDRGVKSIASKHHIAVVTIVAAPMLLQFGFLERVADVFARHEVVVDVIATSEVSLALTTDANARLDPVVAELSAFSEVRVRRDMGLASVVGEELRDSLRVQALVLATLHELGVEVEMLSYGATRNNLSIVVADARLSEIVVALHERLFAT